MAEHDLTITANFGALTAGQVIPTTDWLAGFDHAALVTALRSRADGFDFRLRHTATGSAVAMNISGANTTACKIAITLAANIADTQSDFYTLTTGDLRVRPTPFTSLTGTANCSPEVTITAAALPTPGFPLERFDVYDTVRMDGLTHRTGRRSQNGRAKYRCNYTNISGEDWYELRALVYSVRGAAGRLSIPSWLSSTAAGVVCTDATFSKESNNSFTASLVLEEVIA